MRFQFLNFRLFKIFTISLLPYSLVFSAQNVTGAFTNLKSGTWNTDAVVNGWAGWSTYGYYPTFEFGSHTLTFQGFNSPSNGAGGAYLGTQVVTINAGKVYFSNSTLQIGNNPNTNSASVIFNAPVNMSAGSNINVKGKSYLYIKNGITGSGNLNVDGSLHVENSNKPFEVNSLYLGNSAKIQSSTFSAKNINLWDNVTLDLLDTKGNINVNTFTTTKSGWAQNRTATIDTHANVTVGTINVSNFTSGRTAFINTHGYGDITLTGDLKVNGSVAGIGLAGSVATFKLNGKNVTLKKDVYLGYYSSLVVLGVGNFNAQGINVGNGSTTGNTTLDFSGIKGRTTIKQLDLSTASVYGSNFDITTLIAHKGASHSRFYSNIGTSTIGTLNLATGGSNVDNTKLIFGGGGTSLTIDKAVLNSWAELDASSITNVTVKNLISSYATIRAKNLTLGNASFSNNKTYLYADTITQKNGKFTLNDGALLYIKSGKTFTADTLDMYNASSLYASNTNGGGMSGATTINNIIFNNSAIYANSLFTNNITVKNSANVYLSKGNYTNTGDLNIDDGTYLQIHGGNFINNGEINVSLGNDSSKNAKNLINVLDGSFTFNMTMIKQTSKDDKGNTIQVDVPKAKLNVNVSITGLEAGQTYNLLKTRDGIWFSDNSGKIYKNGNAGYDDYVKLLKNRMSFNTPDGSSLALNYWISDDRKSIGFKYDTGKHYVDAVPYINPGTWVFGIGKGAAAFGNIGGVPAASGLAKNYTLTLQKRTWKNTVTGKEENTIYYMKDLDYHNYGNAGAVFTVDARGSDFALGKNQDIGGSEGSVTIGTNTMKSHMVVKADNIYLGGQITLGDSALISGHLDLQSAGEILGDNKASYIKVRNHSSLKASGTGFKYAGSILLWANQTITDEVGLDLTGITGSIEIGSMEAYAARPNDQDRNAGIKMKNFKLGSLKVYNGNGGSINNYFSDFMTNIGTSSIGTLELTKGTSGLDQSGLKFDGGGDSLTIGTAKLGSWSFLDASKVTNVTITKLLDLPYAPSITYDGGVHGAHFNNLTLGEGSQMNYGGNSDLTIDGNFTLNNNAFINITPNGGTINTINVKGNATFYFNDDKTDSSGHATPLIKISNIKGLKLNENYILFKAGGSITYIYINSEGKELKSTNSKSDANTLYNEVADRIGLYDGSDTNTPSRADVEVKANDKQISFKINELDNSNPYDPNTIQYWLYKRGGMEWIDTISDVSPDIMQWLQELMINKHNGLWAKQRVYDNDLGYFVRIAKELQSTMGQLSSVNRKNNSTNSVRLATDVNRTSRLVKLSNTQANTPTFAEVIRNLQNEHFAASGDIASVYKFANRDTYKNNLWATAIGTASFVEGGNSALYGVNIGYDRFIHNQIIGAYVAYAQGKYTGDIIRNQSYNANLGIYYRAYAGNNEFDASISGTYGYNKENLYSQDIILSQLNQSYNYNTFVGNVNFNYGYVFGISNKSIVLKPQIGVSAYYICSSGNWYCGKKGSIQGEVDNTDDQDLAINANADNKFNIAVNIALETRQYFSGNSYWYFIAGVSRDVFLKNNGDNEVRFVGNDTLSYKKGDQLNTYGSLTAGGELELFRKLYVNLGLGAKAGFAYKDININGSVGMRYVF
ncbi:vacuolating cyotoxin family protein [Helicobacter cappadocius]|uniref:Vacuolating cytotoxin autotransporter n=1 Tax=Helicobacter cappadocius TaxID=3063998 RepID=A0AA90T9Z2_9HELI|nr:MULTISPECIES: vacuolating cyotoxin family protein [unclassified Helicobacter]MDO7253450.1 vacuolating cyotoxin family protein [Helicobacter sp. faydin-H75]MDP2539377.1 vacuolating cyotoxin family protein [Helicobacter sp. faydin-H76]